MEKMFEAAFLGCVVQGVLGCLELIVRAICLMHKEKRGNGNEFDKH